MADAELHLDADFEVDIYIERKNATTREWEAATGLASVSARIAATPAGSAIGSCTVSLTEAGTTGRYVGVLDTATLVAGLATYENQRVYLVGSKSGDFDRVYGTYTVRRKRAM